MNKVVKNVSVMCFHDELCQVFNALMTALSPGASPPPVLIAILFIFAAIVFP